MAQIYEAETIIGIEDIVIRELQSHPDINPQSIQKIRDGFIRFESNEKFSQLNTFKSVIALYIVHHFDVPRPKALLGHQNFTTLIQYLDNILKTWSPNHYTFGLGAAGSNSAVMRRIKQDISLMLSIPIAEDDKGHLFMRLIPAYQMQGWETLIRLTPVPLSTRGWRIKNIPGALNATVAYAMTQIADIPQNSQIVNLCSGTATILIEIAQQAKNKTLIALDNDIQMLQSAKANIEASQTSEHIIQILGDAQQTPFKSGSISHIFADLPFGHYVGSHNENEWLYPAILEESARIAKQGASFVALTHEIQLMLQSLKTSKWLIKHQRQINLSGLHPKIFVLERI